MNDIINFILKNELENFSHLLFPLFVDVGYDILTKELEPFVQLGFSDSFEDFGENENSVFLFSNFIDYYYVLDLYSLKPRGLPVQIIHNTIPNITEFVYDNSYFLMTIIYDNNLNSRSVYRFSSLREPEFSDVDKGSFSNKQLFIKLYKIIENYSDDNFDVHIEVDDEGFDKIIDLLPSVLTLSILRDTFSSITIRYVNNSLSLKSYIYDKFYDVVGEIELRVPSIDYIEKHIHTLMKIIEYYPVDTLSRILIDENHLLIVTNNNEIIVSGSENIPNIFDSNDLDSFLVKVFDNVNDNKILIDDKYVILNSERYYRNQIGNHTSGNYFFDMLDDSYVLSLENGNFQIRKLSDEISNIITYFHNHNISFKNILLINGGVLLYGFNYDDINNIDFVTKVDFPTREKFIYIKDDGQTYLFGDGDD